VTGIPDPSFFVMLQSNGELDIYNFQNDNPKLYSTVVSVSILYLSGSPPMFNVCLAKTPNLSFYGPYMAIGYYMSNMPMGYYLPNVSYMAIGYYLPQISSSLKWPVQSNLGK